MKRRVLFYIQSDQKENKAGVANYRSFRSGILQGVSEISALILTGNRTHQKEQLFSLPFWRKTLRNSLKKLGKIFLKPFISPKLSYLKT
jgi:hypothetical protein